MLEFQGWQWAIYQHRALRRQYEHYHHWDARQARTSTQARLCFHSHSRICFCQPGNHLGTSSTFSRPSLRANNFMKLKWRQINHRYLHLRGLQYLQQQHVLRFSSSDGVSKIVSKRQNQLLFKRIQKRRDAAFGEHIQWQEVNEMNLKEADKHLFWFRCWFTLVVSVTVDSLEFRDPFLAQNDAPIVNQQAQKKTGEIECSHNKLGDFLKLEFAPLTRSELVEKISKTLSQSLHFTFRAFDAKRRRRIDNAIKIARLCSRSSSYPRYY